MWHLCWPLWLGLAGGTFAPPDWKLQKIRYCLFLTSDAHLVGWGWGVSVVLSGIFIVGTVPGALPKFASTGVASIFSTKPIFSAPTKQIFLAMSPPQGFLWFSLLLGSPPCFFQINNRYLKSLKNKFECDYSWWKKIISKFCNHASLALLGVCIAVNDSVGSFYEGERQQSLDEANFPQSSVTKLATWLCTLMVTTGNYIHSQWFSLRTITRIIFHI